MTILLDALHEEVGNPETIKQIASTLIVITRVEFEAKELLNICMPRLQVDSERPIALASLVHILCRVIKHFQHRHDTCGLAIGAVDIGIACADIVDRQPDSTRPLGNLRTLAQRVVDSLDAVLLHVDQKARRQLGMVRARVEQCRSRMDKVALRQGIVGLLHTVESSAMQLNGHTHPHVLRALTGKQVALLQGLETKVVKHEIPLPRNHGRIGHPMCLHESTVLLGEDGMVHQVRHCLSIHLLVVIHQNPRRQLTIIRVVTGLHHCTGLGSKLVKLRRLNAVLNLVANLLRDQIGVHVLKSIGEALQASQHLVEGDRNTLAATLCDVKMVSH